MQGEGSGRWGWHGRVAAGLACHERRAAAAPLRSLQLNGAAFPHSPLLAPHLRQAEVPQAGQQRAQLALNVQAEGLRGALQHQGGRGDAAQALLLHSSGKGQRASAAMRVGTARGVM